MRVQGCMCALRLNYTMSCFSSFATAGNIQRTLLIFLMHFSDFHGGAAMIYMTSRRRCEPRRASSAGPLRHFHGPLPATITQAEKNLGPCDELKMNRHGVADVVSPWSVVPAPSPIQMPRVTATACLAAGYLAAPSAVDVQRARRCKNLAGNQNEMKMDR